MGNNTDFNNSINQRQIATEIIIEVLENDQYLNLVLNQVLRKYQFLHKSQRSYITRVTNGVVERQVQLDYIINTYSNTKVKKMKPGIRNILRLSVYEIFYMDSIPLSATCNEAVKLTKLMGPRQLSGFVNGVLRAIAREDKPIVINDWQTKYSMPEFLIDLFKEAYGSQKTLEILEAYFADQKTCVRVNKALLSAQQLKAELIKEGVKVEDSQLADAFYISEYDYLDSLTSFKAGHFYVQDMSSMMVAETIVSALKEDNDDISNTVSTQNSDLLSPSLEILDVCAAPGGKSLHLASLLQDLKFDFHIESRDISQAKVELILDNINKANEKHISCKVQDATILDPDKIDSCHILIADLPCSGLGVIGKKPDIKYHLSPESLVEIADLQKQILNTVNSYVKINGLLLYSTCTINPKENQDQVECFLQDNNNFQKIQDNLYFPSDKCDGFYICLMKRIK